MSAVVIRLSARRQGKTLARMLAARADVYRSGDRCPSCWTANWHIGRTTAECARCGHTMALPANEGRPS